MKKDKVTTNIRLDREDWLAVKTVAASRGMSLNAYVKRALAKVMMVDVMGRDLSGKAGKKRGSKNTEEVKIWELPKLAVKLKKSPMDASENDKIIYGIDD